MLGLKQGHDGKCTEKDSTDGNDGSLSARGRV